MKTFTITPTVDTDVGIFPVTITLSDSNNETSYNFDVKVMTYPGFNGGNSSFPDLTIALNSND